MDAKQILDEIKLEVARANDFSRQANDHSKRATDLLNTLSDKVELLEKECLICYETLRDPLRTPCNHVYCAACIRDWLGRGRSVCPYCKQNVAVDDLQSVGGAPVQSRTISDPRSVAPAGVRNAHPRNRDTIDRMDTRFAHLNPLAQFTPGAPQHEVQQGVFDPPRFSGTILPFTNKSDTPWPRLQAQSHSNGRKEKSTASIAIPNIQGYEQRHPPPTDPARPAHPPHRRLDLFSRLYDPSQDPVRYQPK